MKISHYVFLPVLFACNLLAVGYEVIPEQVIARSCPIIVKGEIASIESQEWLYHEGAGLIVVYRLKVEEVLKTFFLILLFKKERRFLYFITMISRVIVMRKIFLMIRNQMESICLTQA